MHNVQNCTHQKQHVVSVLALLVVFSLHVVETQVFVLLETSLVVFHHQLSVRVGGRKTLNNNEFHTELKRSNPCTHQLLENDDKNMSANASAPAHVSMYIHMY